MVNARDTVVIRQHNYETHLEVYALTNYRHLVNNNTRAFVNETLVAKYDSANRLYTTRSKIINCSLLKQKRRFPHY